MTNTAASKNETIKVIRWIARIIGLLMILLTLVFAISEGLTEHHPNAQTTPIINIVVGVLMLGGLAVAWKWELAGGLISLIGYIGVGMVNSGALVMPMMYLFAVPAMLFILCWWMSKAPGGPGYPKGGGYNEDSKLASTGK